MNTFKFRGPPPHFSVRGIPIRVHWTTVIIGLFLVAQLGIIGIPAAFLLFASILLHELGHAIAGQRLGLTTRSISLHLLGGTAFLESEPTRPKDELLVALAGPAVSFALAGGLFVLSALLGGSMSLAPLGLIDLLPWAAAVNLMMGLFNMIPALPMDGGRVLRADLAMRLGRLRATRWAGRLARVFAVGFVVLGLANGSLTLPLIGLVVFVMSRFEEKRAELSEIERARARRPRIFYDRHGLIVDVTPSSAG